MGVISNYNRQSREAANRLGGLQSNPNPNLLGLNDQYDAFRHAYTSALIAQRSVDLAKWLGDKNEGP
jgi:hypothetical protein